MLRRGPINNYFMMRCQTLLSYMEKTWAQPKANLCSWGVTCTCDIFLISFQLRKHIDAIVDMWGVNDVGRSHYKDFAFVYRSNDAHLFCLLHSHLAYI